MADKDDGLLTKDDWLDEGDAATPTDNFGRPDTAFPYPPMSPSSQALPTSFWLAVVGIFAQVICIMTFGGSNWMGALAVSTVICTSMILGGALDCLLNSPIAFKTTSSSLTFKIIGLCVVVGTFFAGIVMLGWIFFAEGVNGEYRIDYDAPMAREKAVKSGSLPNGMRYHIKANAHQEGLFSTVLVVDTGSTNEDDDQRGLAHFVEHMAFDKSYHFPSRGAVYSEIMKSGADFNAFTNFRNTVYFLHSLPWSVDSLKEALFLHKNQVLYQDPAAGDIDQERGAVLGEARLHNHTSRWAVTQVVCNHFGPDHRSCRRFPIGLPEQIAKFRPTDFRAYLTKWYRLDRMRLYVVGDFAGEEAAVEAAVKGAFGSEAFGAGQNPTQQPTSYPLRVTAPAEPGALFVHEYDGLPGVDIHLMATAAYVTPMSSSLAVREDTYNDVFSSVFRKQVVARFGQMYPEQLLQGTGITMASASVDYEWSFNATVYSLSVTTRGKPQMSTWKRDLEVALTELKMFAEEGPDDGLVRQAMDEQLSEAREDMARLPSRTHENVAMDLVGNLDPSFRPLDPALELNLLEEYLGPTMTRAVALHVQTCAQILYKAMLECVANTTYSPPPYDTLPPMRSSLNVFFGKSQTKSFLRKINKDSIGRVVANVHMKPQQPISPAGLTVMFMLPFVRSHHSNAAQDLRESDFLLNLPQDPKAPPSEYTVVDSSEATGVHRFVLSNGIGVNIRAIPDDEALERGAVQMQIVALGGSATQTNSLKGACQFINTVKANGLSLAKVQRRESDHAGLPPKEHLVAHPIDLSTRVHHPRTHRVGEADKELEKKDSTEGLSCEAEFMRVSVKLAPPCEGGDDTNECDIAEMDYSKNLLYALDEMRPQYDERTVKLAYQEHENKLEALEQDLRTGDVLMREIVPGLVAAMFPDDVRKQPISLTDLKALDPLEVNRWVREHFVPGRFEINVAGHLNLDNAMKQINDAFGSLPLANFSRHVDEDNVTAGLLHRVGLDPYDPEDIKSFTALRWPESKFRSACVLRSVIPDHAHIFQRVPAGDYQSSASTPLVRRMADKMIARLAFLRLRRDNGFCYHVDVVPRHSVLFPGYGHYDLEWLSGRYSVHQGSPEFRMDLNVVGSSLEARNVFKDEVSEAVFAEIVNTYVQRINASYGNPEYWLHLMQGLSIHPPATWEEAHSNATRLPGLFAVGAVDELQGLASVTRDQVNAFLKKHSWDPRQYIWGIVTTRPEGYGLVNGEVECPMPTHVV